MYNRIITAAALTLLLNACAPRGYVRADELQDAERGPGECAATCEQLGMYMSALVLVDRGTAGCVCSPRLGAQAPRAELEATGAAAAHAMLEAQRQAQQQQAAQMHATPPPP